MRLRQRGEEEGNEGLNFKYGQHLKILKLSAQQRKCLMLKKCYHN